MANRKRTAVLAAAFGALFAVPALAQTAGHEQHHPEAPVASAPASGSAATAQGGHMPMMNMMSGSGAMPMMGMMGQGGMGHGGMAQGGTGQMGGMMAGRVEGRIALLKAELKITEAQQQLWSAVAEAIRANTTMMGQMSGAMMADTDATLPQKLAARDKALSARVDALRKYRTALDPLYAALSDDQKKAADELLPGPMGMMGMGMM